MVTEWKRNSNNRGDYAQIKECWILQSEIQSDKIS